MKSLNDQGLSGYLVLKRKEKKHLLEQAKSLTLTCESLISP